MQYIFYHDEYIVWVRNVQLATLSSLLYAVISISQHATLCPSTSSMMFSSVAAAGGVLVALTLFHAGAIEKTISTACSMAITVLLENVLFSKQIQQFELFDCLTVFISSVTFSIYQICR